VLTQLRCLVDAEDVVDFVPEQAVVIGDPVWNDH
jgi:hypothetical protein